MNSAARKATHSRAEGFDAIVPLTIEHELHMIREAVAMVASGRSQRIVLASLQFGNELLPRAQAIASSAGVRASAVWTLDKRPHSIVIETAQAPND